MFRSILGKEVIEVVKDLFGDGLVLICNCVVKVIESVNYMSDDIKFNEFEMKLLIILDFEVGVLMLVKVGVEV